MYLLFSFFWAGEEGGGGGWVNHIEKDTGVETMKLQPS